MDACALASGSSGNCFYVGGKKSGVLIDAGISSKRIVESLNKIGRKPESIKAILITHEHTDHIRGVDVFSRNFNTPIFVNEKTLNDRFLCSNSDALNLFNTNETLRIAGLEITSFLKAHKAVEPVFFSLFEKTTKKTVSVVTDAGHCCKNIQQEISESNFVFLESNHDPKMLDEGPYPWHVKRWIKSDIGHLSNTQAGLGVLEHAKPKLKNLVLSHISRTNNSPELALKTFKKLLKERKDLSPEITLSYQDKPTGVFRV
jgi:phosphoribosyl 1,2-cyclic phosphodiesterase